MVREMTSALRIITGVEGAWNQGSQILKSVLIPEPMGQCAPLTHFRAFSLLCMPWLKSFLLNFRKSARLPRNREVTILSLPLFYPFKIHGQIDSCSQFLPSWKKWHHPLMTGPQIYSLPCKNLSRYLVSFLGSCLLLRSSLSLWCFIKGWGGKIGEDGWKMESQIWESWYCCIFTDDSGRSTFSECTVFLLAPILRKGVSSLGRGRTGRYCSSQGEKGTVTIPFRAQGCN